MTYRAIASAGGVMLIAGSLFLITLEPDRSIWWALTGGTILGLGFGFVNLVFVVTTQAAVGWQQRGAATASNQFMRQLGSSIGTAAFGAVFNLGLYARVPNSGDVVTRMMDPRTRGSLPPAESAAMRPRSPARCTASTSCSACWESITLAARPRRAGKNSMRAILRRREPREDVLHGIAVENLVGLARDETDVSGCQYVRQRAKRMIGR